MVVRGTKVQLWDDESWGSGDPVVTKVSITVLYSRMCQKSGSLVFLPLKKKSNCEVMGMLVTLTVVTLSQGVSTKLSVTTLNTYNCFQVNLNKAEKINKNKENQEKHKEIETLR